MTTGAFGTWEQIIPEVLSVFSAVGIRQKYAPGGSFNNPLFNHRFPEWKAAWKDRREGSNFINPGHGAQLLIKLTSIVTLGWDETVYAMLDTGAAVGEPETGAQDVFQTLSGNRKFTIQAQFWVTQESDLLSGMLLMERLKTRMDASYARSRLLAVNVDFTDVTNSRDMTTEVDGIQWSVVSADFTFSAVILETEPNEVGYIERVIMSSHEQHGNQDVQASLRQINETLPKEP